MPKSGSPLPSVDDVLTSSAGRDAIARHGHSATRDAVRGVLQEMRPRIADPGFKSVTIDEAAARSLEALAKRKARRLRRVFNLTGTILHTNLGRAVLAERAIAAVVEAMRYPAALEFDLGIGGRGERDDAARSLVCKLTGAESACFVNNNAAAILLVLNTLAKGREAIVSRGELIEIGGSFRMPEIMSRAGARLKEVGTTNRTHLKDYKDAIGPKTGLLLKVHTSNYLIQGFTKEVPARELANVGKSAGVPLVDDLGSGTIIDLAQFGLAKERTVQEALADGADLVTFSGDKLLGGPQAGIIAGRRDLIAACAKNPLKRALRLDKLRLAALEATLQLYRHPETLAAELPTYDLFTRPAASLKETAQRVQPRLAAVLGEEWHIDVTECASQIGSGSLPLETIASAGLSIVPRGRKNAGRKLASLAQALRGLPVPVIGRIEKDALILDLRCLDDETLFAEQIQQLYDSGAKR